MLTITSQTWDQMHLGIQECLVFNSLTLPICESLRLLVVFRCDGQCIEEDEHNHPPVEQSGLDINSAFTS